jgi:hypothetical protein
VAVSAAEAPAAQLAPLPEPPLLLLTGAAGGGAELPGVAGEQVSWGLLLLPPLPLLPPPLSLLLLPLSPLSLLPLLAPSPPGSSSLSLHPTRRSTRPCPAGAGPAAAPASPCSAGTSGPLPASLQAAAAAAASAAWLYLLPSWSVTEPKMKSLRRR